MPPKFLYIFLDESGDLNFSRNGSNYFVLTSVTKTRPFEAFKALHDLRYDLLQNKIEVEEYFHACEDKQAVRDGVFKIIQTHLDRYTLDSVVVEKRKTGPALQKADRFYSQILGYLLRFVLRQYDLNEIDEVFVFAASIFSGGQRKPAEKTVKVTLSGMLPATAKYSLFHHSAKAIWTSKSQIIAVGRSIKSGRRKKDDPMRSFVQRFAASSISSTKAARYTTKKDHPGYSCERTRGFFSPGWDLL